MKEIVKQHPLRTIILQFDVKKQVLDFENQALEAYYRQHDRTWNTKEKLLLHKDALFDLDIKITELEYMLLPIEQQLDFLEAGFQIEGHGELPMLDEEFSIDVSDFNQGTIYHHQELVELHDLLVAEQGWFNEWANFIYEHDDWFDEADDEGDALIHEVFRRYEEVSVDIVSLDRDQQEFFGTVAEVRQLQDEYFAYGEAVFAMYTRLHERSENAYRRAERINDHIDKKFG